MNAVKTGYIDM